MEAGRRIRTLEGVFEPGPKVAAFETRDNAAAVVGLVEIFVDGI